MIVSAPDTPSVCPTCGSRTRFVAYGKCEPQSKPFGWIDPWHNARHAPAAPGSSSPDTAALVAELRRLVEANAEANPGLVNGDILAAADALEAQAARITELEAAVRAALHRATLRSEPDPELEDVLNGDSNGD